MCNKSRPFGDVNRRAGLALPQPAFSFRALEFQILNFELRLCRAVFKLSHTGKVRLPSAPETLNLAIPGTATPNRKMPPKIPKM